MAKRKKAKRSKSRRISLKAGIILVLVVAVWGMLGEWFVHHPRQWLDEQCASLPKFVCDALFAIGNPLADFTDALDLTGHDCVYEYDEMPPEGSVTFAGLPRRVGFPAPNDIRVIDRGEFKIGWSDSLRHPVYVAYHVPRECRFEDGKRPSFLVEKDIPAAPRPDAYTNSGYDRGHMAPNHAIVSRFGDEARRQTFKMANIAPQSASLNRVVWRDVEHRIADFWTARYGEIWVVVGAIPSAPRRTMTGTNIDIPGEFYQLVIAQEGMDVRALAVCFPQRVSWNAWAARYLITIDELEKRTGLDFNPDMPDFIQEPLEAELPTRLWPVRWQDIIAHTMLRFL